MTQVKFSEVKNLTLPPVTFFSSHSPDLRVKESLCDKISLFLGSKKSHVSQ